MCSLNSKFTPNPNGHANYRPYGKEAFKRLISLALTAADLLNLRLRFELFFVKMCLAFARL